MWAEPLLVVAASGRALAQSARSAGIAVQVVDAFGDLDTRAAAAGVRAVLFETPARDAAVVAAAESLCPAGGGLLYGGGLEGRPALLAQLAAGRTLYGNPVEVVERVTLPVAFGRLLDRLGIAHPETRRRRPACTEGWLQKREGGAGGSHVQPATAPAVPGAYYQRRIPGPVLSAAFLADGARARVVGYAWQWCAPTAAHPYRYGGAVSLPRLAPWLQAQVEAAVAALTAALGLRGLNGLDFVVHRRRPWVLEVNPRPGATFELHERALGLSLLPAHLAACEGRLPEAVPRGGNVHGHAILYARRDCGVPLLEWPEWSTDRPVPGSAVATGAPLCSVHASGPTPVAVRGWLAGRMAWLDRRLSAAAVEPAFHLNRPEVQPCAR